jgi:hypothetical protein
MLLLRKSATRSSFIEVRFRQGGKLSSDVLGGDVPTLHEECAAIELEDSGHWKVVRYYSDKEASTVPIRVVVTQFLE